MLPRVLPAAASKSRRNAKRPENRAVSGGTEDLRILETGLRHTSNPQVLGSSPSMLIWEEVGFWPPLARSTMRGDGLSPLLRFWNGRGAHPDHFMPIALSDGLDNRLGWPDLHRSILFEVFRFRDRLLCAWWSDDPIAVTPVAHGAGRYSQLLGDLGIRESLLKEFQNPVSVPIQPHGYSLPLRCVFWIQRWQPAAGGIALPEF